MQRVEEGRRGGIVFLDMGLGFAAGAGRQEVSVCGIVLPRLARILRIRAAGRLVASVVRTKLQLSRLGRKDCVEASLWTSSDPASTAWK